MYTFHLLAYKFKINKTLDFNSRLQIDKVRAKTNLLNEMLFTSTEVKIIVVLSYDIQKSIFHDIISQLNITSNMYCSIFNLCWGFNNIIS